MCAQKLRENKQAMTTTGILNMINHDCNQGNQNYSQDKTTIIVRTTTIIINSEKIRRHNNQHLEAEEKLRIYTYK